MSNFARKVDHNRKLIGQRWQRIVCMVCGKKLGFRLVAATLKGKHRGLCGACEKALG